jgi:hypothetical protein
MLSLPSHTEIALTAAGHTWGYTIPKRVNIWEENNKQLILNNN